MRVSKVTWRAIAIIAVLGAVFAPVDALADRLDDERSELVRRQRALIQELDELAATDEELADALVTLDLWIVVQGNELARTDAELLAAKAASTRAVAAEVAKEAEVVELEGLMADMAVNAYVQPPTNDYITTLESSAAPADAARLNVYLDVKNQRDTDLVRRLREAREELGRLRDETLAAERVAQAARDDAESTLVELRDSHVRLAELKTEVNARQEGAHLESQLVQIDLVRSNEWLSASAAGQRVAGVPLQNVRGLRVHRSIAGQVEQMLAAAEADGIRLGGGGYRTHAEQIELRRAHCGDDPYAIYEMPAGECSPPTARPGNSMHEVGLAVDLTYNGTIIGSHSSPAFRWLAENAHIYGFYNLPSEPWHWSINGS